MSGFLYYFPRVGGIGLLDSCGLADRFAKPPNITSIQAGTIFAEAPAGTVLHCFSGPTLPRSEWIRSRCGRFWTGIAIDHRPVPSLLVRSADYAGLPIELLDADGEPGGEPWVVPIVLPCTERDPERETTLRRRFGALGDSVALEVVPAHSPLVDTARAFLDAFMDGEPIRDPDRVLGFCAGLLAANYRIGADEVLAMGLLGKAQAEAMILAAIDADERVTCGAQRMLEKAGVA